MEIFWAMNTMMLTSCLKIILPKNRQLNAWKINFYHYFLRVLSLLTLTNFRVDLSPPLPKEKFPPGGKSRLAAGWNGFEFWGIEEFCWTPNWKTDVPPDGTGEPNKKFEGAGVLLGRPNVGKIGPEIWFVSSAMVSSTFIWSLLGDTELKAPIFDIPKLGVAVAADIEALDEVNENTDPVEPKLYEGTLETGALSPNENPVDGDKPNAELDVELKELPPNKPVVADEKVLPAVMQELALAENEKPEFEVWEPAKEGPELEFDALATEENGLELDTVLPEEKANSELELLEGPEVNGNPAVRFVVPNGTCPNPCEELFNIDVKDGQDELFDTNAADEEKEPGWLVELWERTEVSLPVWGDWTPNIDPPVTPKLVLEFWELLLVREKLMLLLWAEVEGGGAKPESFLDACENIEGVAEVEFVAGGVLPEQDKGDDPIKNADVVSVLGGLDDSNEDLSATFPWKSTVKDLSDDKETETGVTVDAAAPKLNILVEGNSGEVVDIGGQLELAAVNLLFEENKFTGNLGIASGVESDNKDGNEVECIEPLLWVKVIDVP